MRACYCQVLEDGKHIIALWLAAAPLAGHAAPGEGHASAAWAGGGFTAAFCRRTWVVALAQREAGVRAFEILSGKT